MTTTSQLTDVEQARRWAAAYPEAMGPGSDSESGAVAYGRPGNPRIGRVPYPSGFGPEVRDRENAERETRWNAMSDAEKAAVEHMRELANEQLRRGGRPW